ncbi:MAG: hypothetical protein J7521_15655 [Caulobacter sp.]|nr:hypothetical protein [Caulobacter sp.]
MFIPVMLAAVTVIGLGDRTVQAAPSDQAAYAALLSEKAIEAYATNNDACPGATVTSVAGIPFDDASFPPSLAAKYNVTPLIHERVKVSGCGRDSIQNLTVLRTADQKLLMIASLPGLSRSGLILQRDAFVTALTVANLPSPCGDKTLAPELAKWGEVSITSPPDAKGAWTELWPLRLCGQDRSLSVTFTPTPDIGGTAFSVSKAWK